MKTKGSFWRYPRKISLLKGLRNTPSETLIALAGLSKSRKNDCYQTANVTACMLSVGGAKVKQENRSYAHDGRETLVKPLPSTADP